MNKMQKGFTLIELMIVIAIIGILAAIAIPQYQDYVTRSKITEGFNLAAPAKTALAETYQSLGRTPTGTNAAGGNSWGLPTAASITGHYVSGVLLNGTPTGGGPTITVTYNTQVGGGVISGNAVVLTADTGSGSIAWACGYQTVTANGKTVGSASGNGTTVPAKFLPANCR